MHHNKSTMTNKCTSFALAGNVADMSATCRPDSQMSALLADTIPSQHFRVGNGRHLPLSSFCTRVRMYAQPAKNLYIQRSLSCLQYTIEQLLTTTTNMSHAALPSTGFSSLPPWLSQLHHQLMEPLLSD
jgi:hypothetical protein